MPRRAMFLSASVRATRFKPRGLTVIREEAEVVRTILDLYLQTHSIGFITERLTELGFATKRHLSKKGKPRGGLKGRKSAVYQILESPRSTSGRSAAPTTSSTWASTGRWSLSMHSRRSPRG